MKKNAIALGVATLVTGLGFAGGASASVITTSNANLLTVTSGGVGHSLIQPYFSTQSGNVTLLSVVNTDTQNGKAVKVRFRGASNSDDLFDFQLFLSPGDVWTANVSQGSDGISRLTTSDRSCTLPDSVRSSGGTSFVLDRLPGFADRAAQTREGYVEIFNMADIPETGVNVDPLTGRNRLYTAIKHVGGTSAAPGTPPCSTSALNRLTTNPTDLTTAHDLGFTAPTTGLFGNYILINQSGATTSWSGEMTAVLAARTDVLGFVTGAGTGNIVFFPQTGDGLAQTPEEVTADPLFRSDSRNALNVPIPRGIFPANFDAPDMSTPYILATPGDAATTRPLRQAFELSSAIATNSVRNEFLTTASIGAATDWTFSFPTRRYSTAVLYGTSGTTSTQVFNTGVTGLPPGGTTPVPYFTANNTTLRTNAAGVPQICVATQGNPGNASGTPGSSAADLSIYDREETTSTSGFVISPGTAQSFSFCGEVSVLSFNRVGGATTSAALRAQIAQQSVAAPYQEGWASLNTRGNGIGLPVLGQSYMYATNAANGTGANMTTNYGVRYEHRYDRLSTPFNPLP